MEIQPSPSPSPQAAARKLWNVVRVVFLMLRKGIAKSKLTSAKAILHLHRHHNHHDAIYPRCDYEFSCSNSPAATFPFHVIKRSKQRSRFPHYDDVSTVQRVLEILNNKTEDSPLRKSSNGRKVRVTDSPFPMKEEEEDNQVDVAAEEFIKRFYKDLNLQQKMVAIESPNHHSLWDR
ncbi:unnamed protein product [Sphenostylis stenocarpa]|uniref:Uncharacterized protein n=1 Tax=Sphenostylis stenocarpa TaxID=92480 RepID=A0AA86SCC1_9FABA|nr:unnamed protein product [Sphenostylis stenocarpa]